MMLALVRPLPTSFPFIRITPKRPTPNFRFLPTSSSRSRHGNGEAQFRGRCTDDNGGGGGGGVVFEDFSVLLTDVPWDSQSVWSTMAAYLFSLHIPLSFGGLPAICQILNQSDLDPLTEAASLVLLQSLELVGALILLHYSAKRPYKISSFFQNQNNSEERNWIKAASFGLIFLMLVVLLTSLLADRLLGPKDVNNPELKNILLSNPLSEVAFFSIYCFITPMLEEAVYRGFLLTCLATTMNWRTAVLSTLILSELSATLFHWLCPWIYILLEWKPHFFLCCSFCLQCHNLVNYDFVIEEQQQLGILSCSLVLSSSASPLPPPSHISYQYHPPMAELEQQIKEKAKELKHILKKGMKVVKKSAKKSWIKIKILTIMLKKA
ncbi:hypothetical protein Taro_010660 [Colocasia esculenta]|uniref:CAAX prenyl protease 2/Lysostaphin resistance protein A-like domain-containing protein n=1 Tax=Colocasia esculenta TaxID=4460 RepID=A0A843UDS1_COLES|nr:hypothetical protein [Colocasia esculenta]